jgi:hypothetical protein
VTARRVEVGTDQQQGSSTVSGKHPPDKTQNCGAPIGSLQFHMVVCHARIARLNRASQSHGFFDFAAAVSLVFPDQQITKLAESQASEQTLMAISGHVSRRMIEHYSHIRMEAKRAALDAIAMPVSDGVVAQNWAQPLTAGKTTGAN